MVAEVVDAVEAMGYCREEPEGLDNKSAANSYSFIFDEIESDLLRLAALLKHPSFEEEEEWRIVSPVVADFRAAPVRFREGASMLVPYYEFQLCTSQRPMELEHVFLGPTSHINQSMNSLEMYLRQQQVPPRSGITYCEIPFRQR